MREKPVQPNNSMMQLASSNDNTSIHRSKIQLSALTSIPAHIKELSLDVLVGDFSVVEKVIFEAGSQVRTITAPTFSLFQSLKSITVPSSVAVLGDECFAELTSLKEVTFEVGSELRRLNSKLFFMCGCQSIELRERVQGFAPGTGSREAADAVEQLRRSVTKLIGRTGSSESICIPASVEGIGEHCFAYTTSFVGVRFEAGSKLISLETRSFFGSGIQWIEIPSFVEIVPDSCFELCVLLSRVSFSRDSRLRIIGDHAFSGCGLESVQIPPGVERLHTACFEFCTRLVSCVMETNCRMQYLGESAFALCSLLVSICIPASVIEIGGACFMECEELTSLTFEPGSKLSLIGACAFWGCDALGPSIRLPASLRELGVNSFDSCSELSMVIFEANCRIDRLDDGTFASCSLESFCVPASVTFMDWDCFEAPTEAIAVIFESPSRVRKIVHFRPRATPAISFPDSLESLSLVRDGARGFICSFGPDSRLRNLEISQAQFHRNGTGFILLSESWLKRLRGVIEWTET
jgi:hypothetical protein